MVTASLFFKEVGLFFVNVNISNACTMLFRLYKRTLHIQRFTFNQQLYLDILLGGKQVGVAWINVRDQA